MPISEAKKLANKKWNDAHMKERYDRVQLVLPAGHKSTLEAAAAAVGESVNKYVQRAILDRMGLKEWPDVLPDGADKFQASADPVSGSPEPLPAPPVGKDQGTRAAEEPL